jgi:D-sedoheptulose 7-phosphate isomerase
MLEQRITQHFIDSADLKYQSADSLSTPIAAAVQAVLACVTSGGKVLACGNAGAAALAQYFCAQFVTRFERERPELAAVALSSNAAMLTMQAAPQEVFARQVRALGQAGDVLLAISTDGECANLLAAVEAAHSRDMVVVALCGHGGGALKTLLRETDVAIGIAHERAARIQEIQLLTLHCLCDGVDTQLLGEPLENSP